MALQLWEQPPFIIFGTGGSGTRVLATILRQAGCSIGDNLNGPLDNMDFGYVLAGRVGWMEKAFPFDGHECDKLIQLFKKIYFHKTVSPREFGKLLAIGWEFLAGDSKEAFAQRPFFERARRGLEFFGSALGLGNLDPEAKRWGFKSPDGIYFLPPLIRHFPGIKLIHLVRDGRDMAVSTNQVPLRYRKLFDIEHEDPRVMSYRNWCKVNDWAREYCASHASPNQYISIRYEELCSEPQSAIDPLLSFLDLEPEDKNSLYAIPRVNPATGRWTQHPELFEGQDKKILRSFGY